jgi:hypothetical protein
MDNSRPHSWLRRLAWSLAIGHAVSALAWIWAFHIMSLPGHHQPFEGVPRVLLVILTPFLIPAIFAWVVGAFFWFCLSWDYKNWFPMAVGFLVTGILYSGFMFLVLTTAPLTRALKRRLSRRRTSATP